MVIASHSSPLIWTTFQVFRQCIANPYFALLILVLQILVIKDPLNELQFKFLLPVIWSQSLYRVSELYRTSHLSSWKNAVNKRLSHRMYMCLPLYRKQSRCTLTRIQIKACWNSHRLRLQFLAAYAIRQLNQTLKLKWMKVSHCLIE